MAAEGKSYWVERALLVAIWEDIAKAVRNKRQFKVTVSQQHRIDVSINGVFMDPGDPHHL